MGNPKNLIQGKAHEILPCPKVQHSPLQGQGDSRQVCNHTADLIAHPGVDEYIMLLFDEKVPERFWTWGPQQGLDILSLVQV